MPDVPGTAPAPGTTAAPAPAAPAANPNPNPAPAAPTWREALPEALRGEKTLEKFTGVDGLAKSYVELEKMPRGVTPPKPDAPEAEWEQFYGKLGRPEKPEDYAVNIKVPEGMPWSKAAETNILGRLHKAGLTTKQAEMVINGYLEEATRGNLMIQQDQARTRQEAEKAMRDEWGGLADMNISLVQRAVQEFGGDEFREYLDDTGLGNDPRLMRFVYSMARPMMEDGLIRGEGLGMKRAEAQSEIERLMKEPGWAKGDKQIMARIHELYPIAHGE